MRLAVETSTTTNNNDAPRDIAGCDWSACPGEWLDWDDGHIPENIISSTTTMLVQDPFYHAPDGDRTVVVQDNAVHPSLLQALYETTVQESKPWGTYVTIQQVMQEWNINQSKHHQLLVGTEEENEEARQSPTTYDPQQLVLLDSKNYSQDELAVRVVAAFLHHAVTLQQQQSMELVTEEDASAPNTTAASSGDESQCLHQTTTPAFASRWSRSNLLRDAHGVAVWALASVPGSHVPYHLDYAEQLRYDSNIIVPPMLAGTLQCTPGTVQGGAYLVHTGGLSHYQQHGYKGNKSRISQHDLINATIVMDTEKPEPLVVSTNEPEWIQIPYRTNRLTLQAGHLPHLSTTVESILPTDAKRVIVGFNVFRHNVGPFVQRAPEHSNTFRRKVALQRRLWQMTTLLSSSSGLPPHQPNDNDNVMEQKQQPDKSRQQQQHLSVQAVRSNPWLAKLLVRAKRQRAKDDFEQAQALLDERIEQRLMLLLSSKSAAATITVQELMDQLGHPTVGTHWPNALDVRVHIHRRCRQGRWLCVQVDNNENNDDGSNARCGDPTRLMDCTNNCNSLVSPSARLVLASSAVANSNNKNNTGT